MDLRFSDMRAIWSARPRAPRWWALVPALLLAGAGGTPADALLISALRRPPASAAPRAVTAQAPVRRQDPISRAVKRLRAGAPLAQR